MTVLDPLSNNVLFGRLLVGALHGGRPTGELPTGCHVRAGQGGRTVAGEHVANGRSTGGLVPMALRTGPPVWRPGASRSCAGPHCSGH